MFRNNNQYTVHNLGYSDRKPFTSIGEKNQSIAPRKHPSSSMRQFLQVPTLKETVHHTRNTSEYQNISGYKNLTPLVKPDNIYTDMKQNSEYFAGNAQITSPLNIYNSPLARSSSYQYQNQVKNFSHQQYNSLTLEQLDEKILNLSNRVLRNQQSLKILTSKTSNEKRQNQIEQLQKNLIKQINKQQQLFIQNIQAKLSTQTENLTKITQQLKQYKTFLLDQSNSKKIVQIDQDLKQIKNQIKENINFEQFINSKNLEISNFKQEFKADYEPLFLKIFNQIQKLENTKNITQYKVSTMKCLNSVTNFKYSETIEIIQKKQRKPSKKNIQIKQDCLKQTIQSIYYIDCQGFLLDHNQHYILNSQNKKIKLSQKQLKILKGLQKQITQNIFEQSKSKI